MTRWLPWLFLLCALPTGLGCAMLTPVGLFPDEPQHIARADGLRYGEILGVPAPIQFPGMTTRAGVMMNTGIFNVLLAKEFPEAFPDKPVSAAARRATDAVPWDNRMTYCPTLMTQYFPAFYIPAALGLLAGQKIGLSPLHTVYLGRVAALLAFLAMGFAALALARQGQALLFAVLTLPTVVNLASSYNQDGLMIGACVLAAALLTRPPAKPRAAWLAALGLLVAVGCAKLPYAALMLFCLLPLRAPGLWRRGWLTALACALPALWLLHTLQAGLLVHYARAPYHPGPLWPGPRDIWLSSVVPADNLRVLLAHPVQILLLPLVTLRAFWSTTWPLILGGISSGNVRIWPWEYAPLAVALSVAALGALRPWPNGNGRGADAGLAAVVLFITLIGIEISMYLAFTNAGLPYIEGINARYFLPLLPFCVFILPWAGGWLARLPVAEQILALPAACFAVPALLMAAVNSVALPIYVFHLFHMPGP
ncbi:DUF2142 domain-containing protein [Acidocella sp.]|uniref:DUF2142 domain-containing protein n=1 Tax=Acidocella sp. TaxID=50710 RepID=UPI00261D951F|nr:DUF2142 domain-containing protein [Acidocella sp.]